MELNKFIEKYFDPEKDDGFQEVVFKREAKKKRLRERLKEYRLTDAEIDKLFEIIVSAEMDMEKVKRKYKGEDYSVEELSKFRKKLFDIQNKMKEKFETELGKLLKAKYEAAKKILEEQKKQNPFF